MNGRRGGVIHSHLGGTWSFRSYAGLDLAAGQAVVVLSNRRRDVRRLALRLFGAL